MERILKTNKPKNNEEFMTVPTMPLHNLYSMEEAIIRFHRLYINDFSAVGPELYNIYNTLLDAGQYDNLEVRINSNGGNISELQAFHNIITNYFQERTTTILDPKGFSCGALMFSLGDVRIVHKHSEIMFHDFSSGVIGSGSEMVDQLAHTIKFVRNLMRDIMAPFFTSEEIELMFNGKTYWYDSLQMLEKGIATHILINGDLIEAQVYLDSLKPEVKSKKKVITIDFIIKKLLENKRLNKAEIKFYEEHKEEIELVMGLEDEEQ